MKTTGLNIPPIHINKFRTPDGKQSLRIENYAWVNIRQNYNSQNDYFPDLTCSNPSKLFLPKPLVKHFNKNKSSINTMPTCLNTETNFPKITEKKPVHISGLNSNNNQQIIADSCNDNDGVITKTYNIETEEDVCKLMKDQNMIKHILTNHIPDINYVDQLNKIGVIALKYEKYDIAYIFFNKAKNFFKCQPQEDYPLQLYIKIYHNLGTTYNCKCEYKSALEYYTISSDLKCKDSAYNAYAIHYEMFRKNPNIYDLNQIIFYLKAYGKYEEEFSQSLLCLNSINYQNIKITTKLKELQQLLDKLKLEV